MSRKRVYRTEHLEAAFQKYGKTSEYKAGKQLFMKDDDASEIYFLQKGSVRAYLLYPDGVERTICFIEQGNLVGEEVTGIPPRRIVCADAVSDITITSLTKDALLRAGSEEEAVLRELMGLYMQKIEVLTNWIFYGQFSDNKARIACFLYDHSEDSRKVIYTQEEIAAVTGMSRVSVSKCLNRFESDGLIEKGYGYIRVLERDDLKPLFYDQEFR